MIKYATSIFIALMLFFSMTAQAKDSALLKDIITNIKKYETKGPIFCGPVKLFDDEVLSKRKYDIFASEKTTYGYRMLLIAQDKKSSVMLMINPRVQEVCITASVGLGKLEFFGDANSQQSVLYCLTPKQFDKEFLKKEDYHVILRETFSDGGHSVILRGAKTEMFLGVLYFKSLDLRCVTGSMMDDSTKLKKEPRKT